MTDAATGAGIPAVSVFTPSHDPRYLDRCLAGLLAQTREDWEWIVLLNGPELWVPPVNDPRIRIVVDRDVHGVGAAKRAACAACRAPVLVELDHDDELLPRALEEVLAAFAAHPDASLVYSDCAQILADGRSDPTRYREGLGWQYATVELDGTPFAYPRSLPPTPHNVSLIWFAPNHVRAFRATAYRDVGGYDPALDILDDQDLMSRLYQWGPFVPIDRCLYLQRMHAGNTQLDPALNARIQAETVELYDRYFESSAIAWAGRAGLGCVDVSPYPASIPGYWHLADPGQGALEALAGIDDGTVGVLRAHDALQLCADGPALFAAIHRVLAPSGVVVTATPSTDGRGAFQDPRHVSFYNENSFWYYSDRRYAASLGDASVRFQISRLVTRFPSPWHEEKAIPYVSANLIKLGGDELPRNGGEILI